MSRQLTPYALPVWYRVLGWILLPAPLLNVLGSIRPLWISLNPHLGGDLIIMLAIVVGHSLAHLWIAVALVLFAAAIKKGVAPEVMPSIEFLAITGLVVTADVLVRIVTVGRWRW